MQSNFANSKKEIKTQLLGIYQSHLVTFFCEQPFKSNGDITIQNCKNCPPVQTRIEWMTIVPQFELARGRLCYMEKLCVNKNGTRFKGIRCCEEIDENYQRMIVDLYNYVPELGTMKKQRSHHAFGLIPSNQQQTQTCHFFIDKKNKIVEPAPHLRGIIARTYLYMRDKHHLSLTSEELKLYQTWHQQYPVTAWERERSEKIKKIQGKGNPYVN